MAGPRKIKRYSSMYKKKKRFDKKLFYQIGGSILILVVISFLVYIVAVGINGVLKKSKELNNAPPQTQDTPSSSESSQESSQPPSAPVVEEKIIANQMPVAYVNNPTKTQSFLTTAKNGGSTSVVIPMKSSDGLLLYNSAIPEATAWKAISPKAVSATDLANTVKSQGLTPIAEITAFEDNAAAHASRNNTYYYSNNKQTTKLFSNGKNNKIRYLNPYKDAARKYICDIVNELSAAGFSKVLINGVEFPTVNFDKTTGSDANGVSKDAIMKQFISELNATGVDYILSYDWAATNAQNNANIYGGDPTTYGAKSLSPIIDTKTPPNNIKGSAPEMVTSTMTGIKQKISDVNLIPQVSQKQDAKSIVSALEAISIDSYILND